MAKPWKHPWQVVRYFPDGGLVTRCSHRREWVAELCADRRDLLGGTWDHTWHETRRTPRRTSDD